MKTLSTDANNQKIVRAILQLAKSMRLETVAEGVEDAESLAILREWGCDYAQGYYLHKPAPADAIPLLISGHARQQDRVAPETSLPPRIGSWPA